MTAEGVEQSRAAAERLNEGKPLDAPSASLAGSRVIESNDERRPMPASGNTGGNDSNDTLMPVTPARDDCGVTGGVEVGLDLFLGLQGDIPFHCLPLAILEIESGRDPKCLVHFVCEKEGEGLRGAGKASRGIDPWSQLEPHVGRIEWRGGARNM